MDDGCQGMDRAALERARRLLGAALHEAPVPARLALHAQQALRREQQRLRAAGLTHAHLDAAGVACAQLAEGLTPGRVKLSACVQILGAHVDADGRGR